ncbi:MAG TPA: flagellar motor switch protein FliG [bacterium]|jgi:flagellar motor switch protein FliG|nr:flagellar motor switch protein FliG [bacterium]
MSEPKKSALTGEQKAAALLISLGPDLASKVYQHLKEESVEQVTLQIANLRKISPEEKDAVMQEALNISVAQEYISQGGVEYAHELLEKALGANKAMEIINRLQGSLQMTPFDYIKRTDPQQLLNFIQSEHPQTIALILAHLNPEHAATILGALPLEVQVDVATRIAILDRAAPDVVMEIERVLERRISAIFTQEFTAAGGVRSLAEVLNRADRSTEKAIMEKLEESNPTLAEEVKRLMFVFDDLIVLDNRTVQQILREVDAKDLALALKGAKEEVKEHLLKNMSNRAKAMIIEDMEVMGPVRLKNAEEAQQKIINVVRQLEEQGEIVVARGGDEGAMV